MPKFISLFVLILALTLAIAPVVQAQEQPASGSQTQPQTQPQAPTPAPKEMTFNVKVTYNGKDGAVDQTHKILVFVFDQPEIGAGSMPVGFGSVAENGGVASFTVYATPVYFAVCYDKAGNYDFSGPPASGSPIAIYSKEPPTPAPVALDPAKTTEVEMVFDDTARMP